MPTEDSMGGTIFSVKNRNNTENPYGEVGDRVGRKSLAVRDLPFCVSRTQCNNTVLTHLVMGYNHPESLDEPRNLSVIPHLIHEPCCQAFFQQLARLFFNPFQRTTKTVSKGGQGEQPGSVPSQLWPSPHLFRVSVDRCRRCFV